MITAKRCGRCHEERRLADFYAKKDGRNGLASECKQCSKERAAVWQKQNPEKVRLKNRTRNRLVRTGCSNERYEAMYEAQFGRCLICDLAYDVLCVDHCHRTGEIRGLLCSQCNAALGLLKDEPDRLRRAANYLEGTGHG